MPPPRWERVEELFTEGLERPLAGRREWLDRACAEDDELRREVESLLAAHETPAGFLDGSPFGREGGESPSIPAGTRFGPWQVGAPLGRGGAGEVYLGERADGAFEQKVAIKVLQREAAALLDRFQAERRILARLEHPGIARLLDGGVTADGRPYAVLEFVQGRPLVAHCRERGSDLGERLRLFGQVCEAVAHAHRNLVVHRDLKPGNILVDADGRVKLLDFGIAKLLEGDDAGADLTRAPLTPDYAAPEQLTGESVTTATDVYALGVLLFELLVGQRPWQSGGLPVASAVRLLVEQEAPRASRLAREGSSPVPPRALEGDLDAILAKCLRKQPEHRYESVTALWQDLERHLRLEPVRAREGASAYRLGRLLRRHRWATAAGLAVFLSLSGGLAAFAWQARRARLERDAAESAARREEAVRDHLTRLFRSSLAEPATGPITAKKMLDRSAQRVVEQYRDDPRRAGDVVVTLAELYGALGDVEGQMPLLEGFLAAADDEADPRAVAIARQKLANIELVRGRLDRAEPLLAQAEAFWSTDPEKNREARLEGLFVRGQLQRTRGDLEGSIATYQAAIAERTAVSGVAHRETASLYNSLAITLTAAHRLDEALAAHRQALEIYRRLGRGEDLEALILLGNIGTLAFRVGRLDEAEATLAEAFRKQRELAGDSAAVAAAMGLYGSALTQRGRTSEALPVLREAVALAERFTGPASPLTVQDRQLLTVALATAGDLTAARALLADNLEKTRAQFGPAHILTLLLELGRAKLALVADQPAEAHAQVTALLPALRQLGGQAGTWVAHAQVVAGEALLALGRPAEAAEPLREAVTLRETRLWSGSWELAEARARLGEAFLAVGDPAAKALLETAAETLRAELGPEHPQTLRVGRWLAVARGGG